MYSPRIYENQIPSLYHAAQNLDVPMTQLANSFVYYGLATGDYGTAASHLLPPPNKVLPEGVLRNLIPRSISNNWQAIILAVCRRQ
jgi:hypothetical protein